MFDFLLPVTWEMCGTVSVKANTLDEAIQRFYETADDIPLPHDSNYVDGSFQLSSNDRDFIKLLNKKRTTDKD